MDIKEQRPATLSPPGDHHQWNNAGVWWQHAQRHLHQLRCKMLLAWVPRLWHKWVLFKFTSLCFLHSYCKTIIIVLRSLLLEPSVLLSPSTHVVRDLALCVFESYIFRNCVAGVGRCFYEIYLGMIQKGVKMDHKASIQIKQNVWYLFENSWNLLYKNM